MSLTTLLIVLTSLSLLAFVAGRYRSISIAGPNGIRSLKALPHYYGVLSALYCALPSLALIIIWSVADDIVISNSVRQLLATSEQHTANGSIELMLNLVSNIASGHISPENAAPSLQAAARRLTHLEHINQIALSLVAIGAAILGTLASCLFMTPTLKARAQIERVFRWCLLACASIAILATVGIVLSVLLESIRFFQQVPIFDFLFGLEWSPQIALRDDQQGSSGLFGAVPLFSGTLLIAGIALVIAVPTGLMIAVYLSEYASGRTRSVIKPLLEILAGIPTVVYGFFAALTIAPLIHNMGIQLGLDQWLIISSESALAAGLVMGVMIIPFISSLSDDVINAVPQSLRDAALALGSTRSEVIKQVVIPAALPGIVGSVLLAASRAIGETMIVVMAAGMAAKLTANPLDSVTTVTVQIVTLLVGDQEFNSAKTLAAFALGLVLFVVTLGLNYFALHVVKKYREQYE